jgi:hypothetical protein
MILLGILAVLTLLNLVTNFLTLAAVGNSHTANEAAVAAVRVDIEAAVRHARLQGNTTRSVLTANHEQLLTALHVPPTTQEIVLDECGRLERGENPRVNELFAMIGKR